MGRGALKFKGDGGGPKRKKKKRTKMDIVADTTGNSTSVQPSAKVIAKASSPTVTNGSGKITTSGTVVTGHETKFGSEVRVGDAILVGSVMRVVTIVLSGASINLSSSFPKDLKEPTKYSYISKPRNQEVDAKVIELKQKKAAAETAEHAYGGYAGSEVVYRERTEHGSYRTKRAGTAADLTRSDLLEIRAKKTSDKYC